MRNGNHKEGCDEQTFTYSGSEYNRVKVCRCGAEDHAPDFTPELIAKMEKSRQNTLKIIQEMEDEKVKNFNNSHL